MPMRIKLPLLIFASFIFVSFSAIAQISCGTGVPSEEWEAAFQRQIEQYKNANRVQEKLCPDAVHVIPVVVHVIGWNENPGVYPSIDSSQVKTQIDILNAD